MRHRVGFALRTMVGPWLVVPAFALEIANFLQRGMPWRGEGLWTVEWFAIVLFVLGPLATAAAAVDAARLSRPGSIHLVVATRRGPVAYVHAASWCGAPVIVQHLVFVGCGLIVGAVDRPSAGWLSLAAGIAVQCLAIAWFVALGSAIGRFIPPLLAGLVGGAAGFVLTYVIGDAASARHFRLLSLGASIVSRLGVTYNPAFLASQALVFLVTGALLLLLPLRLRAGRQVPTAAGMAAVLAAAAVIAAATYTVPGQRLLARPRPPTMCSGTAPQICMFYEHRRFAGAIAGEVRTLTGAARAAGYSALVPTRVVESSRTYHPGGPGLMTLQFGTDDAYTRQRVPFLDLVQELLTPVQCPQLSAAPPMPGPPEKYFDLMQQLTYTWLHLVHRDDEPGIAWGPSIRPLTPAQTQRIVDAFARCDLDGGG